MSTLRDRGGSPLKRTILLIGCVSVTFTRGRGLKSQKHCRHHLSMAPFIGWRWANSLSLRCLAGIGGQLPTPLSPSIHSHLVPGYQVKVGDRLRVSCVENTQPSPLFNLKPLSSHYKGGSQAVHCQGRARSSPDQKSVDDFPRDHLQR